MSEDEAIKELKEVLDYKKTTIDTIKDPIQREIEENCYIWEMPFKAIETILDLYNKVKEENEEIQEKLKEEIQIKNEYIDMLNATGKYSRIFKKDWED